MTKVFKLIFLLFISFAFSCKQKSEQNIDIKTIDAKSADAINPYLTKDHLGNTVLCWTSKDPLDSVYRLKYAVYNVKSDNFGNPITVSTSSNLSVSAESMGKVAFKNDGTAMAIFGKKAVSNKNPFAGAIYYSFSTDNGQTWSPATVIHSDTSQHVGHSFFDITRLKNGELAAIWLDGRLGKSEEGSALYFAKTQNGNEFGMDTLLDRNTCECCRTNILTDDNGNIHIAYRGIAYPNGVFGKQVRDMVYISSKDEGKTFSKKKPISNDHWEIEGCPHTGPSLAVINEQINAVWFTAADASTGLYMASALNSNSDFIPRTLISASGRHPQMTTFENNKLAIVFEDKEEKQLDNSKGDNHSSMDMDHSATDHSNMKMDHSKANMMHSKMDMEHSKAGATGIVLQFYENGKKTKSIQLTDGKKPDHHAVITTTQDGNLLIAWVHESGNKASVNYTSVTQH